MKTTFKFPKDESSEYWRIDFCGKEACFDGCATIEYDDCDELEVEITQIGSREFMRYKIRNVILRAVVTFLLFLLGGVIIGGIVGLCLYFCSEGGGFDIIEANEAFEGLSPFCVKSRFRIPKPDGKTIELKYTPPKFKALELKYSVPALEVGSDNAILVETEATFSEKSLRREVLTYWLPILSLVVVLTGMMEFFVIRWIFTNLNSISVNDWQFWGIVFIGALFVALLIAVLCVFIKSFKKCKKIAQNQMQEE